MKKGVILAIVLVVVVLIGLLFLFFNNDKVEVLEDSDNNIETINNVQKTEEENEKENKEVTEEGKTDTSLNDEFEIINPMLTYEGAYNGPLYATSEQVGSASMDSYFYNLDRNGINFFIGMFGIDGKPTSETLITDQGLGEVIDSVQKHPYRIIPFFNPGIGGEEVEQYLGDKLVGMYTTTLTASQNIAGKDFIRGLGEIETQEWSVRHNDQKVIKLIDIANNNNIDFMFHPVANKIDDVQAIIEAYPNTNFLIHLYREDLDNSKGRLIEIMKTHNNLFFSIDAAHIIHVNGMDVIYDYDGVNKQISINKFVSTYDSKEKSIVSDAIKAYKPLVDAVPDKVMWGTEIGPEYAFDTKVFDRAIKVSRLVIAGFNPEHQEGVGYKNALRVFGKGVVVDKNIKVIDTSSWPECTPEQTSKCDESCNLPDSDVLTSEQEECYFYCIGENKCRDVPEVDIV